MEEGLDVVVRVVREVDEDEVVEEVDEDVDDVFVVEVDVVDEADVELLVVKVVVVEVEVVPLLVLEVTGTVEYLKVVLPDTVAPIPLPHVTVTV